MDETHYLKFLPDEVKEKLEVLLNNDLQFVYIPRDILCSSCGCIPLFHYIYPCLHPYCRNCFKTRFHKYKMKCKVCKGELGPRLLQRTSIEHDIYTLKAICPNQSYGCEDVIELSRLLEHLDVCQFTEENQRSKIQLTENEEGTKRRSDEEAVDLKKLKISISKIEKKMDDMTKLEELLLENQKKWEEDIKQMSSENKKLVDECKKLRDINVVTNEKVKAIKEKVKLINIKSQRQNSNIEIGVESLRLPTRNMQIGSESNVSEHEVIASATNIPPQAIAPEVMEQRFRKLENTISDVSLSQMSIRNNVEQYIRVIVAAQLLPEDEPAIRETIFKKIEGVSFVTKESDLGKMIVGNQLDSKKEMYLMKKVIENNNTVIQHQSAAFQCISDTNKENVEEIKKQNMIIEILERKFDKMAEQILKLENTLQEIKAGGVKDKTNTVNIIKEDPLEASRNPWNNLNFNDQEGIENKIEEIKSLKNGTVLFQIENYDKKKKDEAIEFSKPFYTNEIGYKMRIKLEFEKDIFHEDYFISSSIELLSGEFHHSLPPLIHMQATYSILDQSGRREKRDRVKVYEPNFGEDAEKFLQKDNFGWHILSETDEKEIYVKSDRMFIKAKIVALTSLFCKYFSNNGILVWNIDNYERTKLEQIKKINTYIYSDYFYSSESGFRMKAKVVFTNENIHFYLLFLVGEFDPKLPSYFNHKCTVSLINQKQSISSKNLEIGSEILDSSSVGEKNVRGRMSSNYCHEINVSQFEVENEPYLVNDKIVVKIVVEEL